jgi:hypothetical protein
MALITFTPNTVLKSADMNSNFTGITNWSLMSGASSVIQNFVASGGALAISSGLIGTFSNITYFIAGQYYSATSIANKTYTVSKDTYVDINTSGTVTYTEVANNAASPALSGSNIRIGIGVTSGAALTSFNQGSNSSTAPTVSSSILMRTDSLGNLIYPNNPNGGLLGYRQITSAVTGITSTSGAQVTGLSAAVVIPAGGRPVRIIASANLYMTTGVTQGALSIWDGTVGSGTALDLAETNPVAVSQPNKEIAMAIVTPAAGTKTYNVGLKTGNGADPANIDAAATYPAFISVELL